MSETGLSTIAESGINYDWIYKIEVEDNYAIISNGDGWSITDLSNLRVVYSSLHVYGLVNRFFISDTLVYLTSQNKGMEIWDISLPSNPVKRSQTAGYYDSLAITEEFAYLGKSDGFNVVDIVDPANPLFVGSYLGSSV